MLSLKKIAQLFCVAVFLVSVPDFIIAGDSQRNPIIDPGSTATLNKVKLGDLKVVITQNSAWLPLSKPTSESPTYTATAQGDPLGGEYKWTWETKSGGEGKIKIVSGETTATVTLRGDAPSAKQLMNDIDLTVAYKKGYSTAHAKVTVSVRKPTSLSLIDGGTQYIPSEYFLYHFYYHEVKDQNSVVIPLLGMKAHESFTRISGATPEPPAMMGQSLYWSGHGICIRDRLGAPLRSGDGEWRQDVEVDGWPVSPAYKLSYGSLSAEKSEISN